MENSIKKGREAIKPPPLSILLINTLENIASLCTLFFVPMLL
ncbi:hypothetical protein CLOBOL_00835 [Enterocloster bolteae ATCC BAA-613]|uniref:Uncharacterized protein n=1 Tax=Enterocloster bolteae (strain ATCC BAA-613 / DSM 15670 / CCUG 46953 / JCM 12243 / WAL 16351) TaxID=411902 RepID=A8RIZ2_ENTBW|nr:hypothetical protein CLOBOL_00835 [Enterocloster bolteae ATCC BAA-613]